MANSQPKLHYLQ